MAQVIREEPTRERVVERDVDRGNNSALVAAIILIALLILLFFWHPWRSNGGNGTINVSPSQTQQTPSQTTTPSTSGTGSSSSGTSR